MAFERHSGMAHEANSGLIHRSKVGRTEAIGATKLNEGKMGGHILGCLAKKILLPTTVSCAPSERKIFLKALASISRRHVLTTRQKHLTPLPERGDQMKPTAI